MRHRIRVTAVRYSPAPARDRATGLRGFMRITFHDALEVAATARRTRAGTYTLSFPRTRPELPEDQRYTLVRPCDPEARREIEEQVFALLKAQGVRL